MSDTTTQECIKCGFETDCIGGICLECRLNEEEMKTTAINHKLDSFTMLLLRQGFSRNWKKQHKGEFCENQVPQMSNSGIINHALCYYIGCFHKQ